MNKRLVLIFLLAATSVLAKAQWLESYVQQGEVGVSIGAGHYFGDINTRASLSRPKFAGGFFFRKQLNNYVSGKLAVNYAFLGYSDKYSKNETQVKRNLSFNTSIWEVALSGEFNFFKFYPGIEKYRFTPYVSLGVGIFSYDPYAYLGNQKYFLRQLGTEGQVSHADKAPYNTSAICFPLGFGVKYNLNESMNVFAEISYRFTNTDYIDDVSTTYAGPASFPPAADGSPSQAYLLQDRSYEIGDGSRIGDVVGRQRGNSTQKDSYATFQIGVSFNLSSYRCPKP